MMIETNTTTNVVGAITNASSGGVRVLETNGVPSTLPLPAASSVDWWLWFWVAAILGTFIYLWRKGHLTALKNYVGETRVQLSKCSWPSRLELWQHTVIVLVSTVLLGVFTVVADLIVKVGVWDFMLKSVEK